MSTAEYSRVAPSSPPRRRRRVLQRLSWGHVGLVGVGVIGVLAAVPGWIAPYPPEEADPSQILDSPSRAHLLGTDVNGMDILSRLIWAPRVDFVIAVSSTGIGLVIGTLVGAWAGYFAGRRGVARWGTEGVMRAFDVLQAVPVFVLALALVAVLGRSQANIIGVLAVLSSPLFARLTRSAVLQMRAEAFVDAARCVGNSELRLLLRHVLPNSIRSSLVMASAMAGTAIILTAGLSFIGAGVPAPTAEFGSMVAIGAPSLYTGAWWPALFPGVAIGLTVLCFSALGNYLQTAFDPLSR